MTDIMRKLTALLEDPYSRAREEKGLGRKIIGVTPMHFPEELVHAGGALPVVLQESNEPVTLGFGHIYPFYCGFSRSNIDLAVKGKQSLFDAIVVSDMCLQIRHMGHIMRRNMPKTPFVYMQWPLEARPERWLGTAMDRLERCRSRLETVLGAEIRDSAIAESIAVYNRNRALLRQLYQVRRKKAGLLRAKDMMTLVMSSMVLPKEENNSLVAELLSGLKKGKPSDGRVKVFLSGHLCQAVKADILDLVEEMGGVAVGDDLYTGYRYIASDVATELPPMEALARRYMELAVPCPSRSEPKKEWADYIVQATRECGAQGVVVLVVKFCEAHMIYYPYLKDVLAAAGIPHLLLETEHEVVSLEGIKTRLQAFMEMLKQRRGG